MQPVLAVHATVTGKHGSPKLYAAPQDALLLRCVAKHGPKNWSLIARSIPGRTGKSCRLRYAAIRWLDLARSAAAGQAVCAEVYDI